MLQNLINALVNMVDTVMIGRLGTVEIAAVGLGNEVFFLYNMFLFGICSGGSIFTAQFWGKQDIPGLRKNTGLCMILALGMGLLFTLAAACFPEGVIGIYSRDPAVIAAGGAYLHSLSPAFFPFAVSFVFTSGLRSIERVRLPMVSTLIALSLNISLNYLFIFGAGPVPAMGVVGAAYATVIARITETVILVLVSYGRRYALAGRFRELLGFDGAFVRRFLRIAAPVMANEILWSIGITTQSLIMARTGTGAAAAFNITHTVSNLTWVFFMGTGNAAGVLVGKKIGAGAEAEARDDAGRITRFAFLAAIGAGLLLFPLSRALPWLFKLTPEVLALSSLMLLMMGLCYPFNAFNMTMIVGVCRAGGDTVFCALYDLLFLWGVSVPLSALAAFVFHAPVWVIFLCLSLENPLKMILGFWRLRSGKWLHNVVN
ncbi:MAG: MATE family efflux transporter [Treponema sp.]|jgi:putative MATE family efflux protein|nr:MATE family efflux transporter [Treponema sp.]